MKASEFRTHFGYSLLGCQCMIKNDTKLFRQRLSEPHSLTTPSPKLTPVPVQGTAAQCTLWILGRWAGPTTSEVKWIQCVTCIIYYYYLLVHFITYYYLTCYYLLLLFVITLLLHYYCTLLHHSLLHIITTFVITLLLHIIKLFIITC